MEFLLGNWDLQNLLRESKGFFLGKPILTTPYPKNVFKNCNLQPQLKAPDRSTVNEYRVT